MAVLRVPADVSELNKNGFEALKRLREGKQDQPPTQGQPTRRTLSKIAELKKEREGMAKTVEELQAELEAEKAKAEEIAAKLAQAEQERDEYKPSHESYSKMRRTEIAKRIDAVPQEKRAKVKSMSEKLSLEDFKEWYDVYSGNNGQQGQNDSKGKGPDFAAIVAKNDQKALDEAAAADPEGYQKFITSI